MKLPKTFLAVNLSDAFSFQERQSGDADLLEMKGLDRAAGSTPSPTTEEGEKGEVGEGLAVPSERIGDVPSVADQGEGE